MGKSDRKTRKGKIHLGSYGVRRPSRRRRKKLKALNKSTEGAELTAGGTGRISEQENRNAADKK